jgi:hypothetical protein
MIDPLLLCNKHLLGEHGEIHKHRHNFVKQHSIKGRIAPVVQIEPLAMKERHDVLAVEMLRRNMNHCSDYEQPELSYLDDADCCATVDKLQSINDLMIRCHDCATRISNAYGVSQ